MDRGLAVSVHFLPSLVRTIRAAFVIVWAVLLISGRFSRFSFHQPFTDDVHFQVFAQYAHQRPKHWAKYLLSTGYAIWFMYLPSFVASSNSHSRTLRNAFETLKRMLSAKIQPSDEVCYRIVMQLCGQYCQPALAVKVLFEMKNHKILPDAVTYGYYNKVVFESMWPVGSRTPYMLWMKLRHVIRAVTLFSQAGIHQREKIQAKSEETDGISGGQHLAADGLSLNGDDKGNTRGSSDTGFFSLDSEGKRNSMMSLTSGEFMAPIAELKPIGTKIITSVDSSAPTVDTIANCTVEVNGVSTSGDCDISTLQTSSICRKPTDMLRYVSTASTKCVPKYLTKLLSMVSNISTLFSDLLRLI